MATQTKPVTQEPTGVIFRALRRVDVEPNLAYEAGHIEELRQAIGPLLFLGLHYSALTW